MKHMEGYKHPILYNIYDNHIIQIYSGITSGRVLSGKLLYTKIPEVNFFAFAYRPFHEDFSPIDGNQSAGKCKQINF